MTHFNGKTKRNCMENIMLVQLASLLLRRTFFTTTQDLLYYYAGPSELKAHDSKTPEPILCQCSLSINSEKMKNRGFLIISRGREKKHWRETD